jgi:hypothetical protein
MSASPIRMPMPIYPTLPLESLPVSVASTPGVQLPEQRSQLDLEGGLGLFRLNSGGPPPPSQPLPQAPIVGRSGQVHPHHHG